MKIENNHLVINGQTIDELPKLAQEAAVAVYSVPIEYRESGYFVGVQESGQPRSIPSSAEYELIAELLLPAHEDARLEAAKAELLNQAIAEADALLKTLEQDCSEREIKTWDQQAIEAAAKGEVTREMVDAIALYRGLDSGELVDRINAKSSLYKKRSGAIIGAKQYVEDRIEEATNLDDLFSVISIAERLHSVEAEQQA